MKPLFPLNSAGNGCMLAQMILTFLMLSQFNSLAIPAPFWITNSPMHTARYYQTATLLPNGKVLVAGGAVSTEATNTAELYDPSTGTWTVTGSLNVNHSSHTATLLLNGKVLLAGGASSPTNNAELYDPVSGSWAITGSMISRTRDIRPPCYRMARCWWREVLSLASTHPARNCMIRPPALGALLLP